jgi:hypothetical protein
MQSRLLTLVAFTLGFGIIGCDDPEVQSKVVDVMQSTDGDTADLNSEGSCTGRNLEAFGIE